MPEIIDNLDQQVATAVTHYWTTRKAQGEKQKSKGTSDAGLRSAVTGGAQMDGAILFGKERTPLYTTQMMVM